MSFGSTKIHTLPRIHSYEAAMVQWEKSRVPRDNGKWRPQFERPLWEGGKNAATRYRHYRLQADSRQGFPSFSAILYDTAMATYYKPNGDTREVRYSYHSSTTSKEFLWHVCGVGAWKACETTDGRKVSVPLWAGGARLVFVGDKLDVVQSDHQPIAKRISSESDKEQRANVRENVTPIIDLAVMRLEKYKEEIGFDWRAARPWRSSADDWDDSKAIAALRKGDTADIERFMNDTAHKILEGLYSKRCYASSGRYSGESEDIKAAITPTDFRAALERALIANAVIRTGKEPIPMFPDPELVAKGKFVTA